MPAPKIAAVTMVYNEAHLLPLWTRHYGRHVGAANCYVVDHGSDDGSTQGLGSVRLIRLPRSPHDDVWRADLISGITGELLGRYDAVIHTDVDELVVPDPGLFEGLPAWCGACRHDVATAVGLNVIEVAEDGPLDSTRPISAQRRFVAFSSALCKPVLIRRPVSWAPGFHCADAPVIFDHLFLFHLRYCDRMQALSRLHKTRAMPWANEAAGGHQRVSDTDFLNMLDGFARMQRREQVPFDVRLPPLSEWLGKVLDSRAGREGQTYTIDLQVNCYELWPIPSRFVGSF